MPLRDPPLWLTAAIASAALILIAVALVRLRRRDSAWLDDR